MRPKMKTMILKRISLVEKKPLEMADLLVPQPNSKEILVEVLTCGVSHTELDEIEGRLQAKLPIIPGHKIVGRVERLGLKTTRFKKGDRLEDQDSPRFGWTFLYRHY